MRRKGLWLSVLATAIIAGGASAASIAIQSSGAPSWGLNWGTYGVTPGPAADLTLGQINSAEWRHYAVILGDTNYRSAVGVRDGDPTPGALGSTGLNHDTTYPGAGGQNYDAEELFYYYEGDADNGYLHLGLMTGFNPAGELSGISNPATFFAGDIFVDIGNDGSRDLAVGLGTGRGGNAWANSVGTGIELAPYYDGTPNPNYAQYSSPWRIDNTNAGALAFNALDVKYAETLLWNSSADNQRWFYEARIHLTSAFLGAGAMEGFVNDTNGGAGLHWTMQCGNDFVDIHDDTPFAPVPVPAAAPLALLGMAIVGIARRKRQARK